MRSYGPGAPRAPIEPVRVLGVDPGVATTGVAVIAKGSARPEVHLVGAITTPAGLEPAARLALLRARLLEVLEQQAPEQVAVERLFFNANVKTAMAVGQASGVVLATCAEAGLEVAHYTPTQVKQSVVGVGNADKRQVGAMVAALLGLDAPPKPPDAADACALALCHINRSGLARAVEAASR